MRLLILSFATLLIGGFFALSGVLLLFRPDLFLGLYDFVNPGERWNTRAEWRAKVHTSDYKVLGTVLMVFGIFIMFKMLTKLLFSESLP
jgi:hypothetical protein